MPPRIWRSISNATYKQDKGDKLYRRSMYTYWRRTVPPPTMMTLNAAAREVCIVRNDQTTTPLQALTMMNNVTFVESARFLAERVIKTKGVTHSHRIAQAFRMVTSREPTSDESKRLLADLRFYLDDFKKRPEAAKQLLTVGQKKADPKLNVVTLASYALIANTILNLDEAIVQD